MADNEYAGSAFFGQWIWSGGTVNIHGDQRNFSFTPSMEMIDSTAGADSYRRRISSFKDATAAYSGLAQTDGTAFLAACAEGNNGTLIFGEAGTVAGRPKVTMPARAQGVTRNVPFNDVVTYDVSWQSNGDVTYGNW